jgi:transglutaminase-like putative cysteine protease
MISLTRAVARNAYFVNQATSQTVAGSARTSSATGSGLSRVFFRRGTMLIRAGYTLAFECDAVTPLIAMLNLHPSRIADLRTPYEMSASAASDRQDYRDAFGNICTRLILPPGVTYLSCDFVIEDSGESDPQLHVDQQPVEQLPAEVLTYLLGSRYCDTDRLTSEAWYLFGAIATGSERVCAIVDFVHGHLTYGYCYARATRTAYEAYQERVGVCRDFAHLAVALCRCMNIPARYCSGYLGDIGVPRVDAAMDFHAWFEVYLDGAWHAYDARHRVPRIGRILMAAGRDAADTALTTAFGWARLTRFEVHADEVSNVSSRVLSHPSPLIPQDGILELVAA